MVIVGRKFLNNYQDEEAIKAAAAKEEEEQNKTRWFNLPKLKVAAKKNLHNFFLNRTSQDIKVQLKDILDVTTEYSDLTTIIDATQNFSVQNKIGDGGFGQVYKGVLRNGKIIAVKRLSKSPGQGREEFLSELKTISTVKHPNIVRLLGYCTEREELILVYEDMEKNSVSCALFGSEMNNLAVLNWEARVKLCLGVAKGLAFLNQDHKIFHRDVKLSNILLDQHLNPKICDFGLARRFEGEEGKESMEYFTNRIVGTFAYMAPEYMMFGVISEKIDVYSFGIVILELMSGIKMNAISDEECQDHLLSLARALHEKGDLLAIIDTNFCMNFSATEAGLLLNLAMLCTNPYPDIRPTMTEVVSILEGKSTMKTPPPLHDNSTTIELDQNKSSTMTMNMTMTLTTTISSCNPSSNTSILGGHELADEDNVLPLADPDCMDYMCGFEDAAIFSSPLGLIVLEGDNTQNSFDSDPVFQMNKDYIDEEDKDYNKFLIKENVAMSESLKSNPKSSWSTLYVDESKMEDKHKLEYSAPTFRHGKLHIDYSNEEFEDGCNEWKDSLVGCFIGEEPLPMSVEKETVGKLWELKGEVSIFSMENGYFLFQFNSIEDRITVLESAPWLIDERLLLLRKWDWKLKFDKAKMITLPIWVKIYNLPLFLWSSSFLGKVGSCLGVPLYSDRKTNNRHRLSFARLCVEVDASKELPGTLDISVKGVDYKLNLKYDWKPIRCITCCTFGHTEAKCGLKMKTPELIKSSLSSYRCAHKESARLLAMLTAKFVEGFMGAEKVFS